MAGGSDEAYAGVHNSLNEKPVVYVDNMRLTKQQHEKLADDLDAVYKKEFKPIVDSYRNK